VRVLHVVEAFGGGVASAIAEYVASTQDDVEHLGIARMRPGHDTGDATGFEVVGSLRPVSRLPLAVLDVERAVRRLRPDVVHAHSSFGGVFARTALGVPRDRVVYTPHCYAFERTDVSALARRSFVAAERLLAHRTGAVAAVSPREADLARSLGSRRVHYVPQVVSVPDPGPRVVPGGPPLVVTAGRVCPQKDPFFFAQVALRLHELAPGVRIEWIGAGDDDGERALARAGVEVTGWMPREKLLDRLAGADVYVHTAAWEGSPMTVLEASASGVPVVARRIPALQSLELSSLHDTPQEVAAAVLGVREGPAARAAEADAQRVRRDHTRAAQREALLQTYADVVAACAR
jgi:glycosyltransferase involved in cell wall biosynthesis